MVEIVRGDIFDSGCRTLVNPVNCVGVMGAGLAKRFKYFFPDVYRRYRYDCSTSLLRCGNVYVYPVEPKLERFPSTKIAPAFVWCATTKHHWSEPSSTAIVEGVLDGMTRLEEDASRKTQHQPERLYGDVALCYIGAGLGGVKYETVEKLVFEKLGKSKMRYKLFQYP